MMSNPQETIAVVDNDPEISASMASFDRHADIAQKPSIQPRLFRRKINPALILALIDQRLRSLALQLHFLLNRKSVGMHDWCPARDVFATENQPQTTRAQYKSSADPGAY